jgi:hypothetical protein
MMIPPEAIVPLSPAIRSAAAVRAAVQLEALEALHPQHELFVVWCRQDPLEPFAVVMRIPTARILADGWPYFVDRERRVMRIDPPDPEAFAPPLPPEHRSTYAERAAAALEARAGRDWAASPEGLDGV